MKSHDTVVIGLNEQKEVVFLKSYYYASQKIEAQSDLSWVKANCKGGWWLTGLRDWKLKHFLAYESEFNIKLPHA